MNNFQLEPEENEHGVNEDVLSGGEFIGNRGRSVADWLRSCLSLATSANICVAYFTPTGLDVIKHELEDFLGKGGSLSIITSERLQLQLLPYGQDIRILGEEARLRDLDQELEQLRQRVASRREELGNMEIVVAEKPA